YSYNVSLHDALPNLEMQQDGVTGYLGDYDYYLDKIQEEEEIKRLNESTKTVQSADKGSKSYEEEKQLQSEQRKKKRLIKRIETSIEELEMELADVEEEMTKPEVYEDHEVALEYTVKADNLKQEIDQLLEEWTVLHDE